MGDNIFLLTCLFITDEKIERRCTWAWFKDLESAKQAALTNSTDMYECGYYNHVVIEEMPSDMLAMVESETWFYAAIYEPLSKDEPIYGYEVTEIAKPQFLEGTVHFGMG